MFNLKAVERFREKGHQSVVGFYVFKTPDGKEEVIRNSFVNEGELLLLEGFVKASPALPANFYGGLYTGTLGEDDSLTDVAGEPSTNGYARVVIERDATGWPTVDFTVSAETSDTAQGGTSTTIILAAGASATDNWGRFSIIEITAGTGAGQLSSILQYNGTTKTADVSPAWSVTPDATSQYTVYKDALAISKFGLFQASGGSYGPVDGAFLASTVDNTGKLIDFVLFDSAKTITVTEPLTVYFVLRIS